MKLSHIPLRRNNGAAGMGKTRLLKFLAQSADWRGWQVAWGLGEEFAIPHPYAPQPSLFDIHLDGVGAGIEAVFQQFLDDGGRPFDDFTGGDLVDQL